MTSNVQPSNASPPTSFLGLGTAASAYLVVGVLAIGANVLAGAGIVADALFVATTASATAMVILGIRRAGLVQRRGWIAIAATLSVLTIANGISLVARLGFADLRLVANMLFMAAYLPLIAAGFLFGRTTHRSDRTVLLDTGIVALAAVPLVWEVAIQPNLGAADGSAAVVALIMPVIDILLVSVVAPLMLVRASRSTSAALVVSAFAAMGFGDTLYAIATLGGGTSAGPALMNLAWLATYVLLGAAALAPSAQRLGAARDTQPGSVDLARLVVVASALLVVPIVVVLKTMDTAHKELFNLAVISIVMSVLIVWRLQRTISQLAIVDRRFRRFMSHEGFRAAIKDAAGRYIYMNPPAERADGGLAVEWYGNTDQHLYPEDVARHSAAADTEVRRTRATQVGTLALGGRVWHTERFAMAATGGDVGVLGVDITDRIVAEEAARFQARLLASVRDAVIVLDLEGRVTYWNLGATEILGFTAEGMQGRPMVPPIPTGAGIENLDWRGLRQDGRAVWLNVRVTPLMDEDGAATGFLSVANDITGRKEAELELVRLGAAIDNATDGVVVTDADDHVVYGNPSFERITGYGAAEVVGRTTGEDPQAAALARALAANREAGSRWRGDVVGRRRDGADLVLETTISPIVADGHSAAGFVTIVRDVTRERLAERVAERRGRERILVAETLASLHAGQTPEATAQAVCRQLVKLPEVAVGTVIAFGLDGIAIVLGQCLRDGGAEPGKVLSVERSAYLSSRAASGPWVERWLGEPTHPYAALFAKHGIMANAYAPIVMDGTPIGVLVTGSDQVDAVDRMTERLPALLEFSAISGALLAGAIADRVVEATRLASIRSIISEGEFAPVFQPIVDLTTGRIRGYEALTRFRDGTPPDVRFDAAHELGAGLELEVACLGASFAAARTLPADAWLNVNVSPQMVLSGLVEATLPGGDREIILEITEQQAIADYDAFRAAMEPIRDRVKLAIDDAGAGFASLRHVVELGPAMVKLDRSLVAGIASNDARSAVVSGMVRFAEAAGLVLLAEGIETQAELATLRKLGVQLGQGYLLGRPAPVQPVPGEAPVALPGRVQRSVLKPSGLVRRLVSGAAAATTP